MNGDRSVLYIRLHCVNLQEKPAKTEMNKTLILIDNVKMPLSKGLNRPLLNLICVVPLLAFTLV